MMSAGETRKINIPTYLQVLGQLPNVSPGDIEAAKEVLQEALDNPEPGTVRFARVENGNSVEVVQVYSATGHTDIRATVTFDVSGKVYCQARNFSETLPSSIATYFVGGIFGGEDGDAIVLKKIEGVRDLYRCAIRKGGVKNCGWFDGANKFAEAEKFTADKERKEVEEKQQQAENIWRTAEEMREAARGFGAGDPDEIQEIMNRYTSNEVQDAKTRLEKARKMMKEIGESGGGWPQFEKRYHCSGPTYVSSSNCSYGEKGVVRSYSYYCDFDVKHEYSESNCTEVRGFKHDPEGITPGDRSSR